MKTVPLVESKGAVRLPTNTKGNRLVERYLNPMKLWIVGKNVKETEHGIVWEFQGIFSDQEKAIAACHTEFYFLAPMELNRELPRETTVMVGGYYPHAQKIEGVPVGS
jgi:hypothetical protein